MVAEPVVHLRHQRGERALGDHVDECLAVGEVAVGRGVRHPDPAGQLPQRQRFGATVAHDVDAGLHERVAEVAVVVGGGGHGSSLIDVDSGNISGQADVTADNITHPEPS